MGPEFFIPRLKFSRDTKPRQRGFLRFYVAQDRGWLAPMVGMT
jgi:hypothetical protein